MKSEKNEKIYESNNSTIYKEKYVEYNHEVIVKVLNSENPTNEQIIRFNREFEFTSDLQIKGIRKALKKNDNNDRFSLILEWFDGETLNNFIKENNTDTNTLLKIAIDIAQILGQIHEQNIIHRDISPNNILINKQYEIKLIDFGMASKFSWKTQEKPNLGNLTGTLQYIAPEQTGRINRSVDFRTDLYSFGVILYELFTKQLPFNETDETELIYSHIAKSPCAPIEINNNIPKILSDIILKLLSKNAENRYQSAHGLKHDLEFIKKYLNLQDFENLENFKLGENDFSSRLILPKKIYGRENEINKLRQTYERIIQGTTEILFISGKSGLGKTNFVHELKNIVSTKNGIYTEGEFEEFQKDIPLHAFKQALSYFVNIILKKDDEIMRYWRNLIQETVGSLGQVLTKPFPELELIIGKQPDLPKLNEKEALNRFNYIITHFIQNIATAKHPLVIFLKNINWADNASIELLKTILTNTEINNFLCVTSIQSDETTPENPFVLLQNDLLEQNIKTQSIELKNTNKTDISDLLTDILRSKNKIDIESLATLIYSKTSGNPFFTTEFLKIIYEKDLLKFDFDKQHWFWNAKKIETYNITDNVVKLLSNKIQKLSPQTQEVLKVAACIGSKFNLTLISTILKIKPSKTLPLINLAVQEGIIKPETNLDFQFVHNKLLQTLYSLLPEKKKQQIHLKIGRIMLANTSKTEHQKHIFEIVHQLNYATNIITDTIDKQHLIKLNFAASKQAKNTLAFDTAYKYITTANKLLPKNSWKNDYQFTLDVHRELAKLSYLTGHYNAVKNYVCIINTYADNIFDTLKTYQILIYTYAAQSNYEKAIQLGLETLAKFELNITEKPSKIRIAFNFIKTQILFKSKGIDKIKNLQLATNKNVIAQMKLMEAIATSLFASSASVSAYLIFKSLNSVIKYGHSSISPFLIIAHSLVLSTLNKIKESNEVGNLALQLTNKYNLTKIKCRLVYINSIFSKIWNTPAQDISVIFSKNYQIGLNSGDNEYASYSLFHHFYQDFQIGVNIELLKEKTKKQLKPLKHLNQNLSTNRLLMLIQILNNLTDVTNKEPYILTGEFFNEKQKLPELLDKKIYSSLAIVYQLKLSVLYIFNKTDKYETTILELMKYKNSIKGLYYYALCNFYHSLCMLANYRKKHTKEKRKILKSVNANQKLMKMWATHCPENFQHKFDLIEAEKMHVTNKIKLAENSYNKAIKGANNNGYQFEEAISWEATAHFFITNNNLLLARIYLQNAYKCYKKWGALAKLKQLENKYPQFIFDKQDLTTSSKNSISIISNNRSSVSKSSIVSSSSLFDLSSIVKAGQSLSGEIKLEKLLENMLMIIMENSGSEYAVIIKNTEGKFTIEAKGRHNADNIKVLQSEILEQSNAVALNIVKYVIRSQKYLVIDDAINNKEYSNNYYIKTNKIKSVFCYPIIHKSKLVAVLYLENNLSSHVFTTARIETINILSSQIAVSIENALLYENLENKVKTRTKKLSNANSNLQIIIKKVNQQKQIIENSHKKITDSINYAKRIQDSVLPALSIFQNQFSDYFILFKPRNVVSGDFYWAKEINNYVIFIAADCTGHGIPGAFLSMLGISFLNEIVQNSLIWTTKNKASQMLDLLRNKVKTAFQKKEDIIDRKDGMDLALCILNTKTKKLHFAGAYNPLCIIRNSSHTKIDLENIKVESNDKFSITQIKSDKMPIGNFIREQSFKNYEIQLEVNDKLYIFSDGFVDQIGGKTGKKFMIHNFRKLLLEIHEKPMAEQKQLLDDTLRTWVGKNHEQVDDILIIGIKI